MKIQFLPGCFDNFSGIQEELDKIISEITELVESGELLSKSKQIDHVDMSSDELEQYTITLNFLSTVDDSNFDSDINLTNNIRRPRRLN